MCRAKRSRRSRRAGRCRPPHWPLRLAHVFGCAVEDLFSLPTEGTLNADLFDPDPHPVEAPSSSRLALGRVRDRWVAHRLGTEDPLSSDGRVVERRPGGTLSVEPLVPLLELERTVLVGGCAPLIGVLASRVSRSAADGSARWIPMNSGRALDALDADTLHLAGIHLAKPVGRGAVPSGTHEAVVRERFPHESMTLVHLTKWRQGIAVRSGNPLGIHEASDLARPDVRLAVREEGSGTRALLDRLLADEGGVAPRHGPSGTDHASIGRLVAWGVADAGITIEATALALGLDFIPLVEERFDLVCRNEALASAEVVRLLEAIRSRAFQLDADSVPGYDLSEAGEVITVTTSAP